MIVNVVWLQILVEIYATAYEGDADTIAPLDEIYDHLKNDLKDDPELYESISIMIIPLAFLSDFNTLPLGKYHDRVDASWINPGLEESPFERVRVTVQDAI